MLKEIEPLLEQLFSGLNAGQLHYILKQVERGDIDSEEYNLSLLGHVDYLMNGGKISTREIKMWEENNPILAGWLADIRKGDFPNTNPKSYALAIVLLNGIIREERKDNVLLNLFK